MAKQKTWLLYLAAGAGVLALFLGIPSFRLGWIFNLVGLSGAVVIVAAARKREVGHRLPWLLVAVGQVLFVAGDVIAYNYLGFFGNELPFPAISDLFYLSVYPFLIAGIFLLVRNRGPGGDRRSLIDSLIVGIGVGSVSWIFLISPYAVDPTLKPVEKLVAMAYPLMDLVLVTVAVRLAVGSGRRSTAFYLMMCSIAVLFITDSIYGYIVLHGGYDNSAGYLEGGWGLFYLLWGASALHPSNRLFDEPAPESEPKHPRRRLMILGVGSMLAPCITFLVASQVRTKISAAAAAFTFALVLIRLNGLMVDINEYRRSVRALREAEVKYRSLVEGLPAVVYTAEFGEDGEVTYISPQIETVLGFTQEEFMAGSIWRQRILLEDRQVVILARSRLARGEERLQCEYRVVDKYGDLVWIREEADVVHSDKDGRPIYMQGVMYDITAQKKIERQLLRSLAVEQETNRIRAEFVLMINHELRTPLTSVVTGAELLAGNRLAESERRELVDDMIRDSHRLEGMISQMLTIARVENRGLDYTMRPTKVATILAAIGKGNRKLTVISDHLAGLAVETDPETLLQLVLSLADNSITHGATSVSVQVHEILPFSPMKAIGDEPESPLYLVVGDNGPGIDPEFLPRAFEKFEKHSRSSGTGLGLYLVRLMAEAIGASILVRTGPDGTSMAVAIPLLSAHRPEKRNAPALSKGEEERPHAKRRRSHRESSRPA